MFNLLRHARHPFVQRLVILVITAWLAFLLLGSILLPCTLHVLPHASTVSAGALRAQRLLVATNDLVQGQMPPHKGRSA